VHTDLHMDGTADAWVAVEPEVVYDAIVGLVAMRGWSPENRGGTWLDGEPATVGATFTSRNEGADGDVWDTTCTVIDAVRPERFAWSVFPPGDVGTTWRYTLTPEAGGTRLTESFVWDWTAEPDEGFRGRVGRMSLDAAAAVVAGREQQLRAAISVTLDALKAGLEAD